MKSDLRSGQKHRSTGANIQNASLLQARDSSTWLSPALPITAPYSFRAALGGQAANTTDTFTAAQGGSEKTQPRRESKHLNAVLTQYMFSESQK